jgi:hypothetical protein
MILTFNKNGRKASVSVPLNEIRALGWKKGDHINVSVDPKTNAVILTNKKRFVDEHTYHSRKVILEKGLEKLNEKNRRKLVNWIKGRLHAKAKKNERILRDGGFKGKIDERARVVRFLTSKDNRHVAEQIGAWPNVEMLHAYSDPEKRKGLLPEFVLDIEPKKKNRGSH